MELEEDVEEAILVDEEAAALEEARELSRSALSPRCKQPIGRDSLVRCATSGACGVLRVTDCCRLPSEVDVDLLIVSSNAGDEESCWIWTDLGAFSCLFPCLLCAVRDRICSSSACQHTMHAAFSHYNATCAAFHP
eukprot:5184551-Pleurochrysis_carterae.AAC.1